MLRHGDAAVSSPNANQYDERQDSKTPSRTSKVTNTKWFPNDFFRQALAALRLGVQSSCNSFCALGSGDSRAWRRIPWPTPAVAGFMQSVGRAVF
jgi:hypothetical protein